MGDDSLRLDPVGAAEVISQAAAAGTRAATAGAGEGVVGVGGVSPIDTSVVVVSTEEFAYKTGYRFLLSGQTAERESGESRGVGMMMETEAQNAARLSEIGPQGAAATTVSTIKI